jgi:hypothetical protein
MLNVTHEPLLLSVVMLNVVMQSVLAWIYMSAHLDLPLVVIREAL